LTDRALISALAMFHEADAEPWLPTFVRRVRRAGLKMAIAALFCSGRNFVWGGEGMVRWLWRRGEEKKDARLW
jgi:hypothetical protein